MYMRIEDLVFQYKHTKEATIKGFSLSINRGEIISILGESGSGKSTILRLIAGLEVPKSGSISIDGKTIVDHSTFVPPEKRKVGMVFQDYALFPHMTVEDNVKFGLRSITRKEKQKRVEKMLTLVNMKGYEKRYPYELSGGQQQRIALARSLAPAPSLLILDEPFSNLDANLKERIRKDLREILVEAGMTSIFVTHDLDDANAIADHIVYVEDGIFNRMLPTDSQLRTAVISE